jgi:hypothetical protein
MTSTIRRAVLAAAATIGAVVAPLAVTTDVVDAAPCQVNYGELMTIRHVPPACQLNLYMANLTLHGMSPLERAYALNPPLGVDYRFFRDQWYFVALGLDH